MKIVFSTKNVSRPSFLDTCRFAYDYGFEGFEIYDALSERSAHHDSVLRQDRMADAKRKLINRHIAIAAVTYPEPITANTDPAALSYYIEKAVSASATGWVSSTVIPVSSR